MKRRTVLIDIRRKLGLNQAAVAEALGITTSFYGMIEQGSRTPGLQLALDMSRFYKRSVEELFPDLATPPNQPLATAQAV